VNWTASDLASLPARLGWIGAALFAVYLLTAIFSLLAKNRLKRYTLSTGRLLIGRKVKVIRMVLPPNMGTARLLDENDATEPIEVWSDRTVRPGQRARITTLDERGYKIKALARDRTVKPGRVDTTIGR
jgi:hypothetical protein